MKRIATLGLALAFGLSVVTAYAANMNSGPQVGEQVGAYTVKKVAGNSEDGVDMGAELCYRCKMGNRPVVMVFSRSADDELTKLVKELDSAVSKNEGQKLVAFVNLLGSNTDELEKQGKEIVEKADAENVAVVVPKDQPNGPASYKLNPEADTTVLIYVRGVVAANHAFQDGQLDDEAIKKVVADTGKVLN